MPSLESLYFYDNQIKSLDGALQKSKKLMRIGLSINKIEFVSNITFIYCEFQDRLQLSFIVFTGFQELQWLERVVGLHL